MDTRKIRLAINGFGRIGRQIFRIAAERHPERLEIVAINDLCDAATYAHLLRRDSAYGRFSMEVSVSGDTLKAGDLPAVACLHQSDPELLPWGDLGVDLVVEATGTLCSREAMASHLRAGAGRVLAAKPMSDADWTMVMGVSHTGYDPALHFVVSASSCTGNCLAPALKVINEAFGVDKAVTTNVHPYTMDQPLLDAAKPDLRRGRAAGLNIIPVTSGAPKAVTTVLPELEGRIQGFAMRVPTQTVSIMDLSVVLKTATDTPVLRETLKNAATGALQGILGYSNQPLVSSDYTASTFSGVVDEEFTFVNSGNLAKICLWHDNEWGYACRVVDCLAYMAAKRRDGDH